jgi:hypothetical protein
MQTETLETEAPAGAEALEQGEVADRLFGWNLAPITRRAAAREGWSPTYSSDVECEYRKFIYVSVKHPHEQLGMSGPVDVLWHEHILHTMDYVQLCLEVAGRYLHHIPTAHANGDGSEYRRTISLIENHFGEANWNVWPKVGVADAGCCSGCSHIWSEGDIALSIVR